MSLAGALDNGLSRLIFWTERDAETSSERREGQAIDYGVWGLVKRTGNQFRVSMQLWKLSRHRFVGIPRFVIPDLFRDLGFDPLGGGQRTVDRQRGFHRRLSALRWRSCAETLTG
jgi:hypothetical protein